MINVAVVGTGAWGINHVRTFARAKGVEVTMVCDPAPGAVERAQKLAPRARAASDLETVLAASNVDAVVLATPAVLHAKQAIAALGAGKHVLVEKPLALTTADARAVALAAEQAGKVLMVGHLMLYHPVISWLRRFIDGGELGRILYLYALRVNLGTLRRDENAMWSLAPHDISMILHLVGETPATVSARGGCYLQKGVEDVAFLNIRFPSGLLAQVQLSWLDPRKERRLTIVGSQKMVEFDDAHPVEKLRIYDKGYDRPPSFTEYAEYLSIRNGDIHIPRVPMAEPLEQECRHFVDCIANNQRPLTDGSAAVRVVQILEAAQQSLLADGSPVPIPAG
ncbi:MAG: Gfo/Idh/MocA family oxidoreductase [Pseudomonadota bacterium]